MLNNGNGLRLEKVIIYMKPKVRVVGDNLKIQRDLIFLALIQLKGM